MECTVKLLIPCDCFEGNNGCEKMDRNLDSSKLLSPIFGFKNCNKILNEINSRDFFGACGFSNKGIYQAFNLHCFEVVEFFCPYGIIWKAELEFKSINHINKWIESVARLFNLRNIRTEKSISTKQVWNIKGCPVIVLEINNCNEQNWNDFKNVLNIPVDNQLFKDNIIFDNPVVIIRKTEPISNSLYSDILQVLKTICSIYSISRDVRMDLGKILKKTQEKNKINDDVDEINNEDLLKIQKKCALIKEVSSSVLFRTSQQKKLYEVAKNNFHIIMVRRIQTKF